MHVDIQPFAEYAVAPYMGAWIETIDLESQYNSEYQSHPTWVRGLKLYFSDNKLLLLWVAPYMGAWIETELRTRTHGQTRGRTLHGCVD